MIHESERRFAAVALAGKPNAGKSTLLNALVGERLAIVSDKPQSTRLPVVGLWTGDDTQLAFVDPAGLFLPGYALQQAMIAAAHAALREANLVLYLHPITDGAPPPLERLLPPEIRLRVPLLTLLTKADRAPGARSDQDNVIPVSAHSGEGVDAILLWCRQHAPLGPFRYDPTDVSTQPVRFFAAELVREAAFDLLYDEVPYALMVDVEEFREGPAPVYIRMTLHVERESQKRVVIGARGASIKAIGASARARIEALLGERVYLDLRVRVTPKWRRSDAALRRFGFSLPPTRGDV